MFIACEEAKQLVKNKNAQLVDVRTPEEYEASKIPEATNLPLQELDRLAAQLDKSRPVVVFCRSGQRSQMAMQMLLSMGFAEVYNLGPYMAWHQCPDA
ncbi:MULTISPECIES: rhodanese-like domain-containing protein [Thiomicrorhabdus]|uniref:Rhodanese-like domain-containing protein n=1 Tax=Thiomicrorhabdus xiamenensis TaxID=2739063 RepID=A0A7D4SI99_9GAMM|nr:MULTISPECIES: rhodanese-like domain-containing protein [Thiomicrorhabdus]MBO1924332.1 rhodanese-like domain-containing protein [Thiomicrorhabdus sp. 6S3-12]QKI89380.1 rhodanese-like domain-containing protein [Thiomicrorhabdus xiamenensis]